MPNDPAGSFPLPAQTASAVGGVTPESPKEEVKLTDEIAPDLSASPTQQPSTPEPLYYPSSPPPSPRSEADLEVSRNPAYSRGTESIPTGQPAPTPATMPASVNRPFPIITILLLLISIGAIAATYFFYQQSLALNTQLGEISKTLEQQKIKENQATITPTPSLTLTPTSTISAAPSPTDVGKGGLPIPTPSAPMSNSLGLAFADIDSVIAVAAQKYPNAQLILIVATGAESPATTITKYWFRQTLTEKKYLYVLSEPGKVLSIVDHPQLYVRADNNIPPLNQRAANNGLGLDMDAAIKIAIAACPNNFDCANSSIKAQYIDDLKLKTILWQISFTSSSGKLFVVQINAVTKKIIIQYF